MSSVGSGLADAANLDETMQETQVEVAVTGGTTAQAFFPLNSKGRYFL